MSASVYRGLRGCTLRYRGRLTHHSHIGSAESAAACGALTDSSRETRAGETIVIEHCACRQKPDRDFLE